MLGVSKCLTRAGGCADNLFTNRPNRSRNIFEGSLRVVKLTV